MSYLIVPNLRYSEEDGVWICELHPEKSVITHGDSPGEALNEMAKVVLDLEGDLGIEETVRVYSSNSDKE